MSYIYLASPYTDDSIGVMGHRYELALTTVAQLRRGRGHISLAPGWSHYTLVATGDDGDYFPAKNPWKAASVVSAGV